jgi:N-acetylglucosamine-6-phosphate deacetylase
MTDRFWIRAGTLITPRSAFRRVTVLMDRGIIGALLPEDGPSPGAGDAVIDAGEGIVGPGFIDLHVHGGGGHDAMDATPEALAGLAAFHARHGTTSLLPTTVAAPAEEMHRALGAIAEAMATPLEGARIRGAHVEGPFLNPARRGAHPARHVRPPTAARTAGSTRTWRPSGASRWRPSCPAPSS